MIRVSLGRSSRRVGAPLVAFVLVGALPPLAMAQDDTEPITLTYRASDGCPDQAAFVARVRERTARARLVPAGTGARELRAFDVQVDAGRPAYGSLTVRDPDHPAGARRVEAESCAEVVDALALVVALAIDPQATTGPATQTPAADQQSPSPTEAAAPSAVPSVPPPAPPISPKRAPHPPARDGVAASPPEGRRAPDDPQGGLFVGIDAALDVGVSPVALVGPSAYAGWRSKSTALFSPEVRAAVDRAGTGTLSLPGGTAAFTWTVGRVDACPVARVVPHLRLSACARIEMGTLEVAGGDIVSPQTRVRFWLSTGALARGEWTFLYPLFVGLEAGANVRPTNDHFFFLPDTTVYQVPLVGLSAAGGVGAHFL